MSSSRGIGKVGMLVLGTGLGLVSSYILFRLTKEPSVTSTEINGSVIDSATNRLIPGAMVKLSGQGLRFAGE